MRITAAPPAPTGTLIDAAAGGVVLTGSGLDTHTSLPMSADARLAEQPVHASGGVLAGTTQLEIEDMFMCYVSGPDQASVAFPMLSSDQAPQVTVRVARDASGAPPLNEGYQALGAVYQYTPLGWVEESIEIRVPFNGSTDGGVRPLLLIAQPDGDWTEVGDAARDGNFLVARVLQLAYATVVRATDEGPIDSLQAPALRLSFDAAASTPALPAPTQRDAVTLSAATHVALQVEYLLPSGCNGAMLDVAAAVWYPAMRRLSRVPLGQRVVTDTKGVLRYTVPVSRSDNGTWIFYSTATCGEEGRQLPPRNALISVGPTLQIDIGDNSVAPLPTIATAPQDASVTQGSPVTFSVVSQGSLLTYQWQRSNDGGANYESIAGATAASLTFSAVPADDQALFRVVVSNSNGSVTSPPAGLRLVAGSVVPWITSDPIDQHVIEGQTASFSVAGCGVPAPRVQWQRRAAAVADPYAGWSDIEGATWATYTTSVATVAQSGEQFRAVASNSAGRCESLPATLRVSAAVIAPTITTAPAGRDVPPGEFGLFSVVTSGTSPLSYQWFKNGMTITGANASEELMPADAADVGRTCEITVQVSNSAGSVTSAPAAMRITAAPVPAGTSINAAEGGVVLAGTDAEIDPMLVVPPGALAGDATIAMTVISSATLGVHPLFTPFGDAIDVSPASLTLTSPITLYMQPPEAAYEGGKVLAVLELPAETTQSVSGRARAVATTNLRRLAQARPQGNVRIVAESFPVSVMYADRQSFRGVHFLVDITRAACYVTAAVPPGM